MNPKMGLEFIPINSDFRKSRGLEFKGGKNDFDAEFIGCSVSELEINQL